MRNTKALIRLHRLIYVIIGRAYGQVRFLTLRLICLDQRWNSVGVNSIKVYMPAHDKTYNKICATASGLSNGINENPYHTGWMYMVIFAGCTGLVVGFVGC